MHSVPDRLLPAFEAINRPQLKYLRGDVVFGKELGG